MEYAELQAILNNISRERLIATLCTSIGSNNQAKEYLEQCISQLNQEIEKIKHIEEFRFNDLKNMKWMLINIFSDLAKIYQMDGNLVKTKDICTNLLNIIGEDYNHSLTMKQLLAVMFERTGNFELAEKFYNLAGYNSRWHAFRIASGLGHKDFAIQMIEKYVMNEVSEGFCDYVEEKPLINKSMVTVSLIEEEPGYLKIMKENIPNSIRVYLIYGRFLEIEERMSDAQGVYREFIKRYSDFKIQEQIIHQSKRINLELISTDNVVENLWATGKFSIAMFTVLLAYIEERIKKFNSKFL